MFVCTTGFPGIPCPLFIYEPRYRLMVRRAIESGTRQFGIAACVEPGSRYNHLTFFLFGAIFNRLFYRYADFGTMLEIRDCLALNSGCSIVTSIGVSRFRVMSRSEKDGYDLAQVEVLKDEPIPNDRLEGWL